MFFQSMMSLHIAVLYQHIKKYLGTNQKWMVCWHLAFMVEFKVVFCQPSTPRVDQASWCNDAMGLKKKKDFLHIQTKWKKQPLLNCSFLLFTCKTNDSFSTLIMSTFINLLHTGLLPNHHVLIFCSTINLGSHDTHSISSENIT